MLEGLDVILGQLCLMLRVVSSGLAATKERETKKTNNNGVESRMTGRNKMQTHPLNIESN